MITQAKEAQQSHWLSHLCHINLPSSLTSPGFTAFAALVMICNYLVHGLSTYLLSACPRYHVRNCSSLFWCQAHGK